MEELILSFEEIDAIAKKIGGQLTDDLANEEKTPLFICVMKGALNFMAELMKYVNRPILTDYVQLSSYQGTGSTGQVNFKHMLESNPDGRTIIIVEDVVDTGLTMKALKDYLNENFKPKRILICSLFDKINCRTVPATVDYVGVTLPKNKFLIGFGLDYFELERNITYVYTPTKEDLARLDAIVEKDKTN